MGSLKKMKLKLKYGTYFWFMVKKGRSRRKGLDLNGGATGRAGSVLGFIQQRVKNQGVRPKHTNKSKGED